MTAKVVIVGAGLSGLVCAYKLSNSEACRSGQLLVEVVDGLPRAGGVIESLKVGDCLIESGPDSFITNKPYMLELCDELGIRDRVVPVNKKNRGAMVVHRGKLVPLPEGFIMLAPSLIAPFAASPILSIPGKIRAMLDLVLPARESKEEESLASFVRRRFGAEVLEKLAQPMVAGVYVGDAEKLSAEFVAERFVAMERTAGSVIRGLMAEREKASASETSGARYGLFASFDGGLQVVVDSLLKAMGPVNFRFGEKVQSVSPSKTASTKPGFDVKLSSGTISCDKLVLTAPASVCSHLVKESMPELALPLGMIKAASSAVINFVFEKNQISHALNAFGAVIPEGEVARNNLTIIAFALASLKYPRCPENKIIIRAFTGGVKGEKFLALSDDELIVRSLRDLNLLLGIKGEPSHKAVHRWPVSMPQFDVGHRAVLSQIDEALAGRPNLYLAGNSYRGVGLPDCVNSGCQSAQKVLAELKLAQLSV